MRTFQFPIISQIHFIGLAILVYLQRWVYVHVRYMAYAASVLL